MTDNVIRNDCQKILYEYRRQIFKFHGKNILITGGGGFLLSYFCDLIYEINLNTNKKVNLYIVDFFYNGFPPRLKKFRDNSNIFFVKKDIFKNKLKKKFNYIIHGASIASPVFYRKYPLETINANINGLIKLLDENKKNKSLECFLYMSTSEVYGSPDNKNIPTNENYNGNVSFTGPRACYDESKRLGETISILYNKRYQLPIKIIRPFNVYGPGQNLKDGRIMPDLLNSIINNRNLILYSNGKATRSFCYISDQIRGILEIIFFGKNANAYNVGNNEEISINNLSLKLIKISRKNLNVIYKKSLDKNYTTDNPLRRCPDLSKIKSLNKWKPKIFLDEGLKRTLKYYSEKK